MRLTPLDIRKQEFRKGMRGLDSDEVYAFLSTIADEYEAVLNDNKALRERLLELDDKVQEYRNMEKTLRDTLLTAERITGEAKDNARREAELIIKQAEFEADKGVRDIKANAMRLRQEIQALKRQRESYIARMRMLVESHLKFLEAAERDFDEDDRRLGVSQTDRPQGDDETPRSKQAPRRVDDAEARRPSAARRPRAQGSSDSSLSPPLESPEAPLPKGPPERPSGTRATDARARARTEPNGGTVTATDRRRLTRDTKLDELIDRVIEGRKRTPPPDAAPAAQGGPASQGPEKRDVSEEASRALQTLAKLKRAVSAADGPAPDADLDSALDPPTEWSLERLKRDILSKPSKDDEEA